VARGWRKTAEFADQLIASDNRSLGEVLATNQLGEGRSAGDGGNAALSLKSDFGDNSVIHESCEFQDVAARGVLELNRGVWVVENTGVARVLEMIEELRRVHADIVGVVPTSPKTGEKWGHCAPALLSALGSRLKVEDKRPQCNGHLCCHTDEMEAGHTPKRIVSLQPSVTAILHELGKSELLVACTKYCAAICPQVKERNITFVSDSWTAQAEQIREVHPDFVIASVPYQEKALIEVLKVGVPFLALAPKTLANIYSDIAAISRIVGAEDEGRRVIDRMSAQIEGVRQRARDLPRPRVFCEEWGKPLIASQPWVAELVEAAGGKFVGTPGAQIEPAEVEATAPEILIAAWCGAGDRVPLRKIVESRGWQSLQAVKARHVYCICDEYLNTPAPTLVRGLHALAAAIHPEHFPQVEGLRFMEPIG
jgi:iron complex transport system substrate-binding protein